MIPLLLTPHDWQILDGNLPTPMISTRYAEQNSCMGLCRKYYYLVNLDNAEWFAAKTNDGRLVGVSTAWSDGENTCHVDGFIPAGFSDSYNALISAAIEWGTQQKAVQIAAGLSVEDEEKRTEFEALGFRTGPDDGTFTVDDREVKAISMLLG